MQEEEILHMFKAFEKVMLTDSQSVFKLINRYHTDFQWIRGWLLQLCGIAIFRELRKDSVCCTSERARIRSRVRKSPLLPIQPAINFVRFLPRDRVECERVHAGEKNLLRPWKKKKKKLSSGIREASLSILIPVSLNNSERIKYVFACRFNN